MSGTLRPIAAVLLAATVLFTAAQRFSSASPWWLELSRYLPYPAYLAPALVSLVLSFRLGRRWAAASVAALILVATVTMDFHWHRAPSTLAHVRLMTYNIKAYNALERVDGLALLAREVALRDPDILVMQDAQDGLGSSPFDHAGPIFGLPNVFVADQYVIATRLPLQGCQVRLARGRVLFYVSCLVNIGGVELEVVGAHFESPREGLNATRRNGLQGAAEWKQNYDQRLAQSRALASELSAARRPLVVAGDLNAPEASPVVGNLLALGLRDAFSNAGRGYGYTYGHALADGFSFLRIDHILASPDIGLADCFVGNSEPSEHRPLIADLQIPN